MMLLRRTLTNSVRTLKFCKQLANINIEHVRFIQPAAAIQINHNKYLHSRSIAIEKPSLIRRMIQKIPYMTYKKSKMSMIGFMIYETVVDGINYADFFEEFALKDTFYSWFVVTELHLWMVIVRCMAEGEEGRFVRNKIVEAMWSDVGLRAKKIGNVNPAETRAKIAELSEQFQAALIAYDEGLQCDDIVLASAVWRRMYQFQEVDPEHLDSLVKYIRKQVRVLDNVSYSDIFNNKPKLWDSQKVD